MEANNMARAEAYYTLIGEKKSEEIKKYLHPEVEFYAPLGTLKGRESVIQATSNFMNTFNSLKVRSTFGVADQAIVVYDVDIPGIASDFPGAALLTFRDGLIVKLQLFYDGSRVIEKKEEIFSNT